MSSIGTIAPGTNVLSTILMGAQVAATLTPVAIDVALKIKQLLEKDPSIQVDLQAIQAETIRVTEETMDEVEQWRRDNPE
jgi:hypothetical protein